MKNKSESGRVANGDRQFKGDAPPPDSGVQFYKMHGCGNDFILIDNRNLALPQDRMTAWAKALCQRAFGICADGLVFLEDPPENRPDLSFIWHFYNRDGSEGEMCGNAARCAALLAHTLGMAAACHTFGTVAGGILAEVVDRDPYGGRVRIVLPAPAEIKTDLEIRVSGRTLTVHSLVVGVPHAVVFVPDVDETDVVTLGRALRRHEAFAPAGVNVDFVEVLDRNTLKVRTYERGVEDETFACGTGSASAQVIAHLLGHTGVEAVIHTRKGDLLTIEAAQDCLTLLGPACLTFTGIFHPGAMAL